MNELLVLAIREQKVRLARSNFYEYCKLMHPAFYNGKREYLKELCTVLQNLYQGKLINPNTGEMYKKLITCIPRRWGKSFTYTNFEAWVLGNDQTKLFVTISYNGDLATEFSETVRNTILSEASEDPTKFTYRDIFPNVIMAKNSKSKLKWRLQGSPRNNYLGTGLSGTLTGKGASILLIDDIIRNSKEAYNDNALEDHYKFYTGTVIPVIEKGGITIVNFTRWRNNDLIGRILESEDRDNWYVLTIKIKDEITNTLTCPDICNQEMYDNLERTMDPLIFRANFFQETVDLQGRLYGKFKTYDEEWEWDDIISYCDTADTGNDYLCNIIAGVKNGEAFILDVIYTQDSMETTEISVAEALVKWKVNTIKIESNSGGRGFARNVERLILLFSGIKRYVETFHQSKNKNSRILTNSSFVQNNIYFPVNWKNKWPDFYKDTFNYQKKGKNVHDDSADSITGIAEMIQDGLNQGPIYL
jgi:predicted phage terminase large subunit-like protein